MIVTGGQLAGGVGGLVISLINCTTGYGPNSFQFSGGRGGDESRKCDGQRAGIRKGDETATPFG